MLAAPETIAASDRRARHAKAMGHEGVEPPPENTDKTGVLNQSGAESGALDAQKAELSPELAAVVEAWPKLPPAIRAGILAMIRAAE